MTTYGCEKDFLEHQIEMLKEAIDYLSKLISQAEQDLGPRDIYGLHDEVLGQLENGIINLKGKLFDAQEQLKESTLRI
jgi:hypothetical protein